MVHIHVESVLPLDGVEKRPDLVVVDAFHLAEFSTGQVMVGFSPGDFSCTRA